MAGRVRVVMVGMRMGIISLLVIDNKMMTLIVLSWNMVTTCSTYDIDDIILGKAEGVPVIWGGEVVHHGAGLIHGRD